MTTEMTHKLEFSLRDWRQGSNLLQRLCINGEEWSSSFELRLEDEEELLDELKALDLEFRLTNLETKEQFSTLNN